MNAAVWQSGNNKETILNSLKKWRKNILKRSSFKMHLYLDGDDIYRDM
jgi:hypothetical protein